MIMMVVSALLKYALGLYEKAIKHYKEGCILLMVMLRCIILYQSFFLAERNPYVISRIIEIISDFVDRAEKLKVE